MLVPAAFNTEPEPNGDILMYPEGDHSVPPSGRMPAGGYYFDAIIRQPPIDDDKLDPEDNLEEFGPISDADLAYFASEAERLYTETDKAILANFGGTGLRRYRPGAGALAQAPARHPRRGGVVHEHRHAGAIMSTRSSSASARSRWQTWRSIHGVVGDRVAAVFVTGTDFGTQNGPFISPRGLPRAVHAVPSSRSTTGFTATPPGRRFIHSCGSVVQLDPRLHRGRVSTSSTRCSLGGGHGRRRA